MRGTITVFQVYWTTQLVSKSSLPIPQCYGINVHFKTFEILKVFWLMLHLSGVPIGQYLTGFYYIALSAYCTQYSCHMIDQGRLYTVQFRNVHF